MNSIERFASGIDMLRQSELLLTGDEDGALAGGLTLGAKLGAHPVLGEGLIDEDTVLVRRCLRGDVSAFGLLVARHEQRVCGIVGRILNGQGSGVPLPPADVEDISQEIFVQAWRALPRFRGDARFSTWLYRIAVNRALKEYNQRKRGNGRMQGIPVPDETLRQLVGVQEAEGQAPNPHNVLQQRARDAGLREAIESLPEKQRIVVILHYFEDCTCDEIAKIAGCSVGTVWSRLHYACRRLREMLPWLDPETAREEQWS